MRWNGRKRLAAAKAQQSWTAKMAKATMKMYITAEAAADTILIGY